MRYPARVVLALASVITTTGTWGVGAQTGAGRDFCCGISQASAQPPTSGTLRLPSGPQHQPPAREPAVKPPTAAPRKPVHTAAETAATKPPVVAPHGPLHPHHPTGTPAAKAAPPAPPATPVPVPQPQPQPSAETKTAVPDKPPDPEKPDAVATKLPRFASLRSDDVNMRAGPGTRYRIDWVYKRRDLPVEIEREFDVWRWVRDADGIQGWVHGATLMGRRSFIVQKADATLRSETSDTAKSVAILKPGVIGRIRSCAAASDWCNVQAGSYRGFLRREQFWGTLPDEAVAP
ncbi:SH3 domain-containing protein [Rhodopila sp.]|uniref:SH3 domain-containing protein n=1 Tax=Rhodopila sp. TaxID=2480087 RepID=UPI003D11EF1F